MRGLCPLMRHGNENLWDGMGGILTTTGFPPLCAMCHVPAEGEFEGACPLMHAPPRALPQTTFMWSAERP